MKDAVEVLAGIVRAKSGEGQERIKQVLVPTRWDAAARSPASAMTLGVGLFGRPVELFGPKPGHCRDSQTDQHHMRDCGGNAVKTSAYVGRPSGIRGRTRPQNLAAMGPSWFNWAAPRCVLTTSWPWPTRSPCASICGCVCPRWKPRSWRSICTAMGYGACQRFHRLRVGGARFPIEPGRGRCPLLFWIAHFGESPARSDPQGLATEDIVYGFEEMGIATGIDIDRLIGCGCFLEKLVGTELHSRVRSSGLNSQTLKSAITAAAPRV